MTNGNEAMGTSPILSRVYSDALRGRVVFLSASFPSIERSPEYYQSARPFEISDATLEAAKAVFGARGKLVSGAHPMIVPLILSIGRDFLEEFTVTERPLVYVYQSRFFGDIPRETRLLADEGIGEVQRLRSVDDDREKSLLIMRQEMLQRTADVTAGAILIGGMEGVYSRVDEHSEFHLFSKICKGRPIYPIGSTGGAARLLLEDVLAGRKPLNWNFRHVKLEDLLNPTSYTVLMRNIILDMVGSP